MTHVTPAWPPAPDPANGRGHRGSLRGKLLRSHLTVAALGLAGLSAALLGTLWLRDHAVRLAETRAPTVRDSMRTMIGIQRSLAAIRGWMVLGDPVYRVERERAWKEDIEPAVSHLRELSTRWTDAENATRLDQLERLLKRLESEQWWIEDVARTPGNEPARVLLTQDADPVAATVHSGITAMIEMEKGIPANGRRPLLAAMADMRASFTRAQTALARFVDQGADADEREFRERFGAVRDRIDFLGRRARVFSADQRDVFDVIRDELLAYEILSSEVIAARRSDRWNVAQHRLATRAAPTSREVARLLDAMTGRQDELMKADASAVTTMSGVAIGSTVALMLGMSLAAWFISAHRARALAEPIAELARATERLGAGELREDIPVPGDDELGALTRSFNSMRASLQASEDALSRAIKNAEAANRAKSRFLANMSHELRTPLNSIIGFTRILSKNKKGNLQPGDLKFLDRVEVNGKHLLGLINQVLDLSKIEAGRVELEQETVALNDLIEHTLQGLEGQLHERPIALRTEIPGELDPIVTDRGKLQQVLINLVGNALKFTERGMVTVRVAVDVERRPVRIDVADTGIGIPPDKLQSIFDAFQQVESDSNRKFEGTGLGLAISRALCQKLGYDLTVRSEMDEGTVFSIHIEWVAPGDEREKETAALADSSSSSGVQTTMEPGAVRTALVVDDDADARDLLAHHLEELGYRVTTAASGPEALRLARERVPDVITLDLLMPGMNGKDVLKQIRANDALRHVPVVVVSIVGSDEKNNLDGVEGVMDKPLDRNSLVAALRRHARAEAGGAAEEGAAETRELLRCYIDKAARGAPPAVTVGTYDEGGAT